MKNKTKEVHVFLNGLEFPVLIFTQTETEHERIMILNEQFRRIHFTVENLCIWAMSHGMEYQIFVTRRDLKNPIKRCCYKKILGHLEQGTTFRPDQ